MLKSAVFFILIAASIFGAQTTFTVKEWMGVSRTNEPVSGGIAFPAGAVSSASQLALFDGSTEIPAQFFPLVTRADGSAEWVLVDFTGNFAGNEERTFTLKTQSPSASPSNPITVTRNGSIITISNNVLSFSFDTVSFKGIQSLVYGSKTMISGAGGVSALDLVKGTPDTNGPVTKAQFVYLGATRATYRVEGTLYQGSCGGLGYSYMMTVYAGSPRVIIDVTLRNSINASCGRVAKISRAFAGFNLGFDPAATVRYDTLAGHMNFMYTFVKDTIRSTRAFEDGSGAGLAVTEKWGGGPYENFLNRTALSGRKLEVEIIQPINDTMAYGTRPGGFFAYVADSATRAGSGPAYVYYLMDYSHKTSQIVLECYNGNLTPSGLRGKMFTMKHRLVPHQAPADLSASAALSIGKFGTLQDEQACHTKWGWQTCDPFPTSDVYHNDYKIQTNPSRVPTSIGRPDCAAWMDIESHYDIEMDYLQGYLLQWIRYGNRDYFDLAEATGRYYENYAAYRSDGFIWDGQDSYFPQNAKRTTGSVPTPGMWDPTMYGTLVVTKFDITNWGGCHFFFTGLTDYYCMTGDPDALDACRDLAEVVKIFLEDNGGGSNKPADPANSNVDLGYRAVNRKLNYWTRYYEITRDPAVLAPLTNFVKAAMKSKKVDPYFWQKSPFYEPSWAATPFKDYKLADTLLHYLRANHLGIEQLKDDPHYDQYVMHDTVAGTTWPIYSHPEWQSYWLVDALENWLRLFPGDDDVRDYIIGYSNYITKIKDGYCDLDNYEGVLSDFPRKGMYSPVSHSNDTLFLLKWDTAHAHCATTVRASRPLPHNTWNNALVVAVQAAGFRHTGFSYFLKQAEHIWGIVSGNYPVPGPVNEPATYATIDQWEFYHNDRVTKVVPFFYEEIYHTDTLPPDPVIDLSVTRLNDNTGVVLNWTAPAGGAVSYQVKYFQNKQLADYPDYDYANFDTTKIPWWYAVNVDGEPAPSAGGTFENFTVHGNFPKDSVFYAAVRSRDAAGNLSRLSNIVRIDSATVKVEAGAEGEGVLCLATYPNPFNPAITLKVGLPSKAEKVLISIYDATGRLVWKVEPQVKGKKMVSIPWAGRDILGQAVGSGIYFVRLSSAGKQINRKIVMVR